MRPSYISRDQELRKGEPLSENTKIDLRVQRGKQSITDEDITESAIGGVNGTLIHRGPVRRQRHRQQTHG